MRRPRALGFWSCLALVIGNMIGSGVFLLPAALAPYGWNAIIGWIVTIVGSLCLALVFSRLAHSFPAEGGPYAYSRLAFGDAPSFALAWSYWISIWVTNSAIAIAAVSYLSIFAPALAGVPGLPALLALGFVWTLTLVNCLSIRAAGNVQVVTTALKLLPLLAAILITLAVIGGAGARAATLPFDVREIGLSAITATASLTLWAMLGFESATIPARVVEDPERNIPRATMIGTLLAGGIYLIACSGVALLLPPEQAAHSNAPFADFVERYVGRGPALMIGLFAAISAIGALNGWVLLQGEMPLAMARGGVFPPLFGRLSRAGTPVVAQIASSGLATILVLSNYSKSMGQLFTFMALLATVATLVMYFICSLASLRLMHRRDMARSAALATAAALGAVYSLWTFYGAGAEATGWGAALIASGAPVYLLMRGARRSSPAPAAGPAAPRE